MIYDFDELPDRRGTESIKWNKYAADVLPMWVADMDFRSPQPVVRALEERVRHAVFGYPQEIGDLRRAISERLKGLYAWTVEPHEIIFMPGVIRAFNLACQALAAPDGAVLVQPPVYPPILTAPEIAGVLRQEAQLVRGEDRRYYVDWEAFEAAIDARTRLFILCNPQNPTGRVFTRGELERMAEVCMRHGVVICSDEIHSDLVYAGEEHLPMATLSPQAAQNTITLMAPSKTFNLPGLQFSYVIIQNSDLRERYLEARIELVNWVNLMGQVAALAAYQDGQEWYDQLMEYLVGNREYVDAFVEREMPGISMARPEGTYLAWLDCRRAGIQGNPQEFFLEHARVALNDGAEFGSGGAGFVRINFACPRALLSEGLARMRRSLEQASHG
jgi:cystathionine beta-lyase